MKVQLDIRDDEELRSEVLELIKGCVHSVVRHDLINMIETQLIKIIPNIDPRVNKSLEFLSKNYPNEELANAIQKLLEKVVEFQLNKILPLYKSDIEKVLISEINKRINEAGGDDFITESVYRHINNYINQYMNEFLKNINKSVQNQIQQQEKEG